VVALQRAWGGTTLWRLDALEGWNKGIKDAQQPFIDDIRQIVWVRSLVAVKNPIDVQEYYL